MTTAKLPDFGIRIRRAIGLTTSALLVLLALAGCGGTVPADALPSADALKLPLVTLEGAEVHFTDLAGQVVLVDFWATWCAPCRAQHKVLEELYPEYDGEPVEFIAVNVGESTERVAPYVADHPFSYPLWMDPSESLANRLEIIGLPSLLIIDATGDIRFLRFGITGKGALRREIEGALGSGA